MVGKSRIDSRIANYERLTTIANDAAVGVGNPKLGPRRSFGVFAVDQVKVLQPVVAVGEDSRKPVWGSRVQVPQGAGNAVPQREFELVQIFAFVHIINLKPFLLRGTNDAVDSAE